MYRYNFRRLLLGILAASIQMVAFAGSGIGGPKITTHARIHYLGIGQNVLFTLQDEPIYSDFSCSDVQRVERHLLKRAKGKDSFYSVKKCVPTNKKAILTAFQQINFNSRSDDYFVFYFGGYTHKVKRGNKAFTAFFLSPPKVNSANDTLADIDSNLYFTIADLRLWMNALPPRNQVVLIEAGFTNELKSEFTRMLIEGNEQAGVLENRKRILLFPQGIGIEDAKLKSGQFTWIMTNGLDTNQWNILDVFDPEKADEYEYACWRSYVNINRTGFNAAKGINLIKEWELQAIISPSNGNRMRGENVAIAPPRLNSSNKDTLPRFFAFLCATDNYRYMDPLSNPIFDAKTLADVLKTKYGFHTHLLPNPESVDVFRQELRRFTDSVKFGPRDELLVFMAGHGYYDTLDGFGYVAFSNTHKRNISEMYEMRNLVNILDNRPCKKIMLIMDVCFGGMLSQGLAQQSDPRLCNPPSTFAKTVWPYNGTNAAQVYDFLNCSNRVYLTSGGYEYVSDGTPGAHSPFAEVLINSLNANNDDLVLSDEIVTQVKKNIKAKSTPQRPTSGRFGLDNNSTDFVFVKKAN